MMENKILKLCPFCGGKAFVYYSGSPGNGDFSEVICKKCNCRTDRLRGDKAIEAWNRRANDVEVHSSACINQGGEAR